MRLKDFYVKDDSVVSAMYDHNLKSAVVVVSPGGTEEKYRTETFGFSSSCFVTKNLLQYSVPCSQASFNTACAQMEIRNKHTCKCKG